jgi:hypothetical protein
MQKHHDLADHLLLSPGVDDPLRAHRADAVGSVLLGGAQSFIFVR